MKTTFPIDPKAPRSIPCGTKAELNDLLKNQKRNYNQESIANKVGISQGQLSNIFNGRRKASPELIQKITKAVGIKFSQN